MQKELIAIGKTTEEAIENGLAELGVSREEVEVEVIETSAKGLFGFIGQKDAKVLLKVLNNENSVVKEFVEELLLKMGVKAEAEVELCENNLFKINLTGDDMGIIIGRRGETLDALQHIVQMYVNGKFEKYFKIRLDTESYRQKREEVLANLANGIAKKVLRTRKEVILEPMKAYERRIIHTALQEYAKIKTYSIGDEPNRKLVVAYRYVPRDNGENKEAEASGETQE